MNPACPLAGLVETGFCSGPKVVRLCKDEGGVLGKASQRMLRRKVLLAGLQDLFNTQVYLSIYICILNTYINVCMYISVHKKVYIYMFKRWFGIASSSWDERAKDMR